MEAYSATFAIRHNMEDTEAVIAIVTKEGFSSVRPLILAEDPVVITYESTELTGTVHPSQLKLSLVATEDGQYRDILESLDDVWCILAISKSPSKMPNIWYGVLAGRTWSEPFSRKSGYRLELTFSDFGYLDRIDFNPDTLFPDGEAENGWISVDTFLRAALSLIVINKSLLSIEYHDLSDADIDGTSFKDLLVSTKNFMDSDGSGLALRECIEKVLAPAGVHISQHNGAFHLYHLNDKTYNSTTTDISLSLKAAGTDAEIESAEVYKKVSLSYDQEPDTVIAETAFKASDTGYEGPWQYVDNGVDVNTAFHICGPRYRDDAKGHLANYINGTSVTPCLWLVNGWATQFKVPEGFTAPDDMPEDIVSDLATLTVESPVSPTEIGRGEDYPPVSSDLKFVVRVLIAFAFIGQIHDVRMRAEVVLSPADSSAKKYLTSAGWADSDDGSYLLHYENQGTSDYPTSWPTQWQNLVGDVPPPPSCGKLTVTIYPATSDTDYTYTGEITPVRPPTFHVYSIQYLRVENRETFVSQRIVAGNEEEEEFEQNAEDFSKDFDMGTPVLLSTGTYTNYMASGSSGVVKTDDTYLKRYMKFLRNNFSRSELGRRRWHVRGTYMYNHLDGLPVFSASAAPLKTLPGGTAYFLMSEEWHVRRGESMLEIEEVCFGSKEDVFYFNSPASLIPPVVFRPNVMLSISGTTFTSGDVTITPDNAFILGQTVLSASAYWRQGGSMLIRSEYYIRSVKFLGISDDITSGDLTCDTGRIGDDFEWTGSAKEITITTSKVFSLKWIKVIILL